MPTYVIVYLNLKAFDNVLIALPAVGVGARCGGIIEDDGISLSSVTIFIKKVTMNELYGQYIDMRNM